MSLLFDLLVLLLALSGLAAIALAAMLARPLKPPPPLASVLDGAPADRHRGAAAAQPLPGARRDVARLSALSVRDRRWKPHRPPRPRIGRRVGPDERDRTGAGERRDRVGRRRFPRPRRLGNPWRRRLYGPARRRSRRPDRGTARRHPASAGVRRALVGRRLRPQDRRPGLWAPRSSVSSCSRPISAIARRRSGSPKPPGVGPRPTCRESSRSRLLARLGIDWPQSLPVLGFATGPGSKKFVTDQYTFRLMASYAAPDDWKGRVRDSQAADQGDRRRGRRADGCAAFSRVLAPLGVRVTVLPGVDHMGLCWRPEAIKAVAAALNA